MVDDKHQVRVVDKYANDVLGGDPPPVPAAAAAAEEAVGQQAGRAAQRDAPPPATPGPGDLAAGRPPTAPAITRYVVEGGRAEPFEVGANQRSVEVTGLTNGETYRFSVHAVNGKGDGPARQQQPGGADGRGARPAGERRPPRPARTARSR